MDKSTAGSLSINELEPDTDYTVEVRLACNGIANELSPEAVAHVKTLKAGTSSLK